MDKLLTLLEQNARLTNEQLAVMLQISEQEIEAKIEKYKEDGIIKGFKTIIDKDKLDVEYVVAIIELRVTPKRDAGFDEIAKRVCEFDEVESVYLMSGGFDLALIVNGRDFKDIALFVAKKVSLLDSVLSTKTHFILSKYKDQNFMLMDEEIDERRV